MRTRLMLAGLGLLAALGLAGCRDSSSVVRVYVEPTYEKDRLERILAQYPDIRLEAREGEGVSLRVEALPDDPAEYPRTRRALIRAREVKTGYEAYAVAEFLRVQNPRGGRARWASSYEGGIREDDVGDILFEVVREAAHHQHAGHRHSLDELVARLHSTTSVAD
ncbi:MAG: hypothetical protein ACRD4U_08250 [Candidatus Acidiferrales bacterium]